MTRRRNASFRGRTAHLEALTLRLQRAVLVVLVAAVPLVFWRGAHNIFNVVKFTTLLAGVLVLVALSAARGISTGKFAVPATRVWWPALAFLTFAAVATATSDLPVQSLVGSYGPFGGLALYTACVALFAFVLRAFNQQTVLSLGIAILVGGLGVAGYGLVQWAGADPIPWLTLYEGAGVTSFVGNPNFVSAHAAIAVPVAAWGVLQSRWPTSMRVASAGIAVVLLVALMSARSDQGPLAAGAGLLVFALVWLHSRPGRWRRIGVVLWPVPVVAGLGAVLAGVRGLGPLAHLAAQRGTQLRLLHWQSAVAIGADHPLLGAGLDRFGRYDNAYRPPEGGMMLGLEVTTETPNSVLLNMFASGGIPLTLAHVVFVVVIGLLLLRGMRLLKGDQLLLLGALGGAWAAYQAQAFVSVDIPSLAATHWVLAGAIVVLVSPPDMRWWRLPWAPPVDTPSGRRGPQAARKQILRERFAVSAAMLPVVLLWPLSVPLRADVAAQEGFISYQSGLSDQALTSLERAVELADWQIEYYMLIGQIHLREGRLEQAHEWFDGAADRDPRALGAVISAAQVAESLGELTSAEQRYRQALALEPHHPDLLLAAARVLIEADQAPGAQRLLERALELGTDDPDIWASLGIAREKQGDAAGARHAYERALELEPAHEETRERLHPLGPGS